MSHKIENGVPGKPPNPTKVSTATLNPKQPVYDIGASRRKLRRSVATSINNKIKSIEAPKNWPEPTCHQKY